MTGCWSRKLWVGLMGAWVGAAQAGMTSISSYPQPVYRQADLDKAYADGYSMGVGDGRGACLGDPKSCGITLKMLIPGSGYAETEPNDHIVAANPMTAGVKYWGQSYSEVDEDWFFFTTNEPNMIATLNFTVPSNTTDVSGWTISVRDAAGNVLAQFNTSYVAGGEISYPTALSHVGTYYVVIKPTSATGTLRPGGNAYTPPTSFAPYNIALLLTYSNMDHTPVDVNFYDTETEPNNSAAQADPIVNTVTMFGQLSSTIVGSGNTLALQSEQDWFWYNSPGNEIISLLFCGKEDCNTGANARQWRVTVLDASNQVMTTFATQGNDVRKFGLERAGNYFIQIVAELVVDATGRLITTECQEWSTPTEDDPDTQCKKYSAVAQVNDAQYNFTWLGTKMTPFTYNP